MARGKKCPLPGSQSQLQYEPVGQVLSLSFSFLIFKTKGLVQKTLEQHYSIELSERMKMIDPNWNSLSPPSTQASLFNLVLSASSVVSIEPSFIFPNAHLMASIFSCGQSALIDSYMNPVSPIGLQGPWKQGTNINLCNSYCLTKGHLRHVINTFDFTELSKEK